MPYHKTNEPGVNFEFFYDDAVTEAGVAVAEGKKTNLWTVIAENANASACYLHFYDAPNLAAVTVGTTVPVWSLRLHGNTTIQIDRGEYPIKWFRQGLVIAATAGLTGNTAPGADPQVTLHF